MQGVRSRPRTTCPSVSLACRARTPGADLALAVARHSAPFLSTQRAARAVLSCPCVRSLLRCSHPGLRLVIMSATLSTKRFVECAAPFACAPSFCLSIFFSFLENIICLLLLPLLLLSCAHQKHIMCATNATLVFELRTRLEPSSLPRRYFRDDGYSSAVLEVPGLSTLSPSGGGRASCREGAIQRFSVGTPPRRTHDALAGTGTEKSSAKTFCFVCHAYGNAGTEY